MGSQEFERLVPEVSGSRSRWFSVRALVSNEMARYFIGGLQCNGSVINHPLAGFD